MTESPIDLLRRRLPDLHRAGIAKDLVDNGGFCLTTRGGTYDSGISDSQALTYAIGAIVEAMDGRTLSNYLDLGDDDVPVISALLCGAELYALIPPDKEPA